MLHGQVVAPDSEWQIPAYAQSMLWVRCGEQAVQACGPLGEFSLAASSGDLLLVWGVADGPALGTWPVPAESTLLVLGWQGTVGMGGFIERLHTLEVRDLDLVIAEIEGDLLPPGYARLPSIDQMRAAPFRRTRDSEPVTPRQSIYTVMALADSVHADYLHHALVSELALDCFATLGAQSGGWHEIIGLPLLVDAVSLLAPGYR